MITKAQASSILWEVRQFYKNDLKSSNKRYDIKTPYDNIDTFLKQATRNDKQKIVTETLNAYRAKLDDQAKTLLERGKLIGQQPRNSRKGNCEEMALLAGYYCVTDGNAESVFLGCVKGNGDHAFCLIGPQPTASSTTPAMMAQHVDATAWAVDPWANICCPAKDYYDEFMKKMAQWGDGRKRIQFKGTWVDPAEPSYLLGFAMAELSFRCIYQPPSAVPDPSDAKSEVMDFSGWI